jgi:hypothetical protein
MQLLPDQVCKSIAIFYDREAFPQPKRQVPAIVCGLVLDHKHSHNALQDPHGLSDLPRPHIL